jgi:hypothetical protein
MTIIHLKKEHLGSKLNDSGTKWGSYCTWRCSFCNLKGFGNSIHGTATIANKTSITWTAPTKQQHQPTVRLFCVRLGIMSCMYASSSVVQIHSCVKQMSASWTWIAVARKQGFLIKSEVYWQCKKDVHISLSLSLSLSYFQTHLLCTKALKCLEVYTNAIYGDFINLKQLEHIIETELCTYFMHGM